MASVSIETVLRGQRPNYICHREVVNMEALTLLIEKYGEVVELYPDKTRLVGLSKGRYTEYTELGVDESKARLYQFLTHLKRGKSFEYGYAKGECSGRLYLKCSSTNKLSGQMMPRRIRHTIYKGKYFDLDFENAFPVFLRLYCVSNGLNEWVEYLTDYIKNRTARLEEMVASGCFDTIEDAKNYILKKMNGGGDDEDPPNLTAFCCQLIQSLSSIRKKIYHSASPEWVKQKSTTKNYNLEGSYLSKVLCEYENYFLGKLLKFCEEKGIKNVIPCFDGMMVPCEYEHLKQELIDSVEALGIEGLRLREKPLDMQVELDLLSDERRIEVEGLVIHPKFEPTQGYNFCDFFKQYIQDDSVVYSTPLEIIRHIQADLCKVMCLFMGKHSHFIMEKDNKVLDAELDHRQLFFKVGEKGVKIRLETLYLDYKMYFPYYCGFVFYPNGLNYDGDAILPEYINTWGGFKAKEQMELDPSKIERVLKHLKEVWANDNEELYEYFLDWFSHIIQFPHLKTKILIFLQSNDQQVGKNIITNFFSEKVLGKHLAISNMSGLTDFNTRFNANLYGKLFCCVNELPKLSDQACRSQFDKLKSEITDNTRTYEVKNGSRWEGENYMNLIACSQHTFSLPIEQGDRRIVATTVSSRYGGNASYFNELSDHLQQDNADHFITFLRHRNLVGKNLRNIPNTQLKQEMQLLSKGSFERYIDWLREDQQENEFKELHPDLKVPVRDLYEHYKDFCQHMNACKPYSQTAFAISMKKTFGHDVKIRTEKWRGYDLSLMFPK